MNKIEFRKNAIKTRDLAINRNHITKSIEKKLFDLNEFKQAKTIFSYKSFKSEVMTDEINNKILEHKKILALPKTCGDKMSFKQVVDIKKDLEIGSFNILEPKENLENIYKADVCIIPGVAFSKDCFRMGYGKGFYDRFLENKDILKIGISFDEQIFDKIPTDKFDVMLDIVITPTKIYRKSNES